VHLLFGTEVLPSFVVLQAFLALLLGATFAVARRLTRSAWWGLLAALVVMGAPGVLQFSRQYHFALPSAALYAAAVYAQLRANGFRHRGWGLTCGILLGLLVLTRTVMLAFLPGFVVAAVITVVAGDHRLERFRWLALSLAIGAVTAGLWYWKNLPLVLEYLLSFGYGQNSEFYGSANIAGVFGFWTARLANLIQQALYLPLATILLAALLAGGVGLINRRLWRLVQWTRLVGCDAVVLLITLVEGYVILTSTRNSGSGFVLVLVSTVVVLSLLAIVHTPFRLWRALVAVSLVAVSLFNVAVELSLSPPMTVPRPVAVLGLGLLPISDTPVDVQEVVSRAGAGSSYDPSTPPTTAVQPEDWMRLERETAAYLVDFAAARGQIPIVWFASRDNLFNTNSVALVAELELHQQIPMGQLSAVVDGDRSEAYRGALALARPQPNFLITGEPGDQEFRPSVAQALAEDAARSLGYQLVNRLYLPDGREARIWWLVS
jgi:hypothetical protein